MGFGFDYVDNAYYRVQNGELDGISPRVIIVLLGTNNLGHRKDTPQACADNIRAFVRLVRRKCPSSKILLLGVLPRKEKNPVSYTHLERTSTIKTPPERLPSWRAAEECCWETIPWTG